MPDAGSPLRIAALAATAGCAVSLAACGERPISSPAQEAHAPIARESELAGAPPAPPEPAAPPEAPPPEAAPPPPPPAPDRGGEVIYDLGPVVPGPGAPRAVTPPPPPEHGRRHYTFGGEHAPAPAPHRMVRPHAAHPRAADHRAHPAPHTAPRATPSASSHPAAVSAPPHAKPAPPAPHVAKPAPKAAAPAPPTHRGHGARTPHAAPKPPAAAERTAEMSALQTALTQAVKTGAVLTASTRAEAGRATDATLTLPAAFAETVRAEATKRGLTDKAASANISAALAGDGYAVTPDAAQSQPLTIGQPVEFHWTVIRQPDGKGPLTAQVRADLLGGGSETLDLGSVSPAAPSGFNLSPKSLGAGLLALIAVVVLGWFARGRSSAKPAAILGAGRRNGDRPFDMEPRRGPDDTKL